jgi:hypothetical protein
VRESAPGADARVVGSWFTVAQSIVRLRTTGPPQADGSWFVIAHLIVQ